MLLLCCVTGCATVEGGAGGMGLSVGRRADFAKLRFDAKVDVPAGLLLGTTGVTLAVMVGYGAVPAFALAASLIGVSEGQSTAEAMEDFWIIGPSSFTSKWA